MPIITEAASCCLFCDPAAHLLSVQHPGIWITSLLISMQTSCHNMIETGIRLMTGTLCMCEMILNDVLLADKKRKARMSRADPQAQVKAVQKSRCLHYIHSCQKHCALTCMWPWVNPLYETTVNICMLEQVQVSVWTFYNKAFCYRDDLSAHSLRL